MTIRRAPRQQAFTVLNTSTFNLDLPPEELGIYLHLLSKPDDWVVNGVYLRQRFGMSKDRTYRILNALCDRRVEGQWIVQKTTSRDEKGQLHTEYVIREPSPENQDWSSPENPVPENQDVQSIDIQTTTRPEAENSEFEPSPQTLARRKANGITYDQATLDHYRTHLEDLKTKGQNPNEQSGFITWCKREAAYQQNESGRQKRKSQKQSLWDMDDRDLLKLAEESGVRTHGKSRQEIIQRLQQ